MRIQEIRKKQLFHWKGRKILNELRQVLQNGTL